jgi:ankyrin repeat protein
MDFLKRFQNNTDLVEVIEAGKLRPATIEGMISRLSRRIINAATDQGKTPLMAASHKGLNGVVRKLIESGADVHACDSDGNTALHHVFIGNPGTARGWMCAIDIVRAGAPINAFNQRHETPLLLSAVETVRLYLSGYAYQMDFMLSHGASLLATDELGRSCARLMIENPMLFSEKSVGMAAAQLTQASLEQATAKHTSKQGSPSRTASRL